MKHGKGHETNHRGHIRHMREVAQQNHERQLFMQELKEVRKKREKHVMKNITKGVGPLWYQVLSIPQRNSLDQLEFSMYQDILEGRPVRTLHIMKELGLNPRPNAIDLMDCVYSGREDPKLMLAHLFLSKYGHPFEEKRLSYCLNSRLILSAILYLGLENLLSLLKEKFQPDIKEKKEKHKPVPKEQPPLESPYLEEIVSIFYWPHQKKKIFRPAPLPNLDDLNEPCEEDTHLSKPPPPPPPSLLPKKYKSWSECDKRAGIMPIEPYSSVTEIVQKSISRTSRKRLQKPKRYVAEVKKKYGLNISYGRKGLHQNKPTAPNTGFWNSQYTINGVFIIKGKSVFVIGNVSVLPVEGEMIHGGFRCIGGDVINIHCGFRGRSPPQIPDPCDCVKKWQDVAFRYVQENKCRCKHYYDYGNEGSFPPEEVPFFIKPTKFSPYQFNYDIIYNVNEKSMLVLKEFKRFWDTDSVLHIGDPNTTKVNKKKKKKRCSATCLGDNPDPEDYLRCALRQMRRINIAAKLPDVHLVPELIEWMRRRIYGPFSRFQKREMLNTSTSCWQTFTTLVTKGGNISPSNDLLCHATNSNWDHKKEITEKFTKYLQKYKLDLYKSYANIINILWPTMCQSQVPDEKFREIYFSYFFGRIEDLLLINPYSSMDSIEKRYKLASKRNTCPVDINISQISD